MFAEDAAVFFNTAEFANTYTVQRANGDDVEFVGIFEVDDEAAFSDMTVTAQYRLTYPATSVTLKEGDTLVDAGQGQFEAGTKWRVRSVPRRTADGFAAFVLLSRWT